MGTYTYIARDAADPQRVITFTLRDDDLFVDLGSLMEQAGRALQGKDGIGEGTLRLQPWLKPAAVSLLQQVTRPFCVADVYGRIAGGGLQVTAWARVCGLRLAPVTFIFEQVDNPDAAQAFVSELARRRGVTARPGRFPAPLDYWASWVVAGSLAGAVLAASLQMLRRRRGVS